MSGTIQRLFANAKSAAIAGGIAQNAIPVNLMKDKRVNQDYTMVAVAEDEDGGFGPVIIVEVDKDNVFRRLNNIEVNDLLHSMNAYSKKRSSASNKSGLLRFIRIYKYLPGFFCN